MARIPILQDPKQISTGNQTVQTPNLPAVTNASLGKALGDVATVAFDISERTKRVQDVKNLTTASLKMQEAQSQFAKFQLEQPDESKWLPEWESIKTRVQSEIGEMPLTPDARNQATERFGMWSINGTTNVQAQSLKQAGRNAALSVENAIQIGRQTGDFTAARMAANDYKTGVPMSDEEKQSIDLQIQGAERQFAAEDFKVKIGMARDRLDGLAMMDAVIEAEKKGAITPQEVKAFEDESKRLEAVGTVKQIADVDPVIAKAKIKAGEFAELTPQEKANVESYAEGVHRDFQNRERSEFADFIVNGGNVDDFKFQWNLGDAEQAELRLAAKKPVIVTSEQAAVKRLEMEAKVGKYDMDKDPDRKQMIAISAELDALKNAVPYAFSDLGTAWANKTKGKAGSLVEMDIADHDDYVQKLYKPQLEKLLDDKGNIMPGKEAEFRKLQSEATDLKKKYRKQIGSEATPEKARKASQDILALPTADNVTSFFDMLDDAPNPLLPSINATAKELQP